MPPRGKRALAKAEESDVKKLKSGLAVGDACPDFELETDESSPGAERKISLKEMVKDNGVVIFAYPRANTPGCTTQACGFKDKFDVFEKAGYKVYGLSADKPRQQANWRKKHCLQFNLLCDTKYEVLEMLGMTKTGKKITRSHIVIEKGGLIKDIKIGVGPKSSIAEASKTVKDKTPVQSSAPEPEKEEAEAKNDDRKEEDADEPKEEEKKGDVDMEKDSTSDDPAPAQEPGNYEGMDESEPVEEAKASDAKAEEEKKEEVEGPAQAASEEGKGDEGEKPSDDASPAQEDAGTKD
ncbi:hypothetical protein BSKO_09504 [Bryopsis sp. KO-2023]|nr:hypothetical protein BSKO_09504 [Bryopsis sp. KO-2023]